MKNFLNKLWAVATSLEVAVVLILVLSAFQIVGALLPQGMDPDFYVKAWGDGTYTTLRDFGLLNIFRGPVFIIPALLLGVNLLCCSIKILKRFIPEGITGRNIVSALYHLAILAMFGAFLTTFLVAYGGELTIKPGETITVLFKKGETRWAGFAPRLGLAAPRNEESSYKLRLKKFETTYVEKGGKLFVKDWLSDLEVWENGKVVKAKRIQVNDPLVYGGVKYYQAFFDQKIKFRVDGEERELGLGEPLKVGKEMRMVSMVKSGTLLAEDGPRPLGPYVELKTMPKDKWARVTKDVRPGQRLDLGKAADVSGHDVTFVSFTEASGLTYKHDPAVKYLWVIWILFTALIAVRIYLQESLFLWFRRPPEDAADLA